LKVDTEDKKMEKEEKKNDPEGLVVGVNRLVDLVAYRTGSVVSRTIIDKKTGTVTLFSFDEGQGLSEHTVPFDALVCLLDGEAEISISSKPFRLRGGEMIVMPAGEPHALKAVERFKMLLTMIRS
jgi:quercetin dioxygenase-like cupin family protein